MAREVEFYFDVGSPAAYIAWTQMPALARETGATVQHRPMLLGGVFHATGNQSPSAVPAKGNYLHVDLARFAGRHGVPYRHNPFFPINTLMLMRGATGLLMREPQRFVPYVDAVYKAIWVEGLDMNDAGVVGRMLAGAGFDPAALLALTQDQAVKDQLKATTEGAVARGVFGAPTFFVGDQMFWGQDRLDFVREALQP